MTEARRVIKRYANRKLYDTHESRYVTLDQISELIRQGDDVQVVDNATKEDLTSVTLAQIIFEEEKRQRSFLPLSALRKIIQSGGESLHDFVNQIQESAGRFVPVFRREDGSLVEPNGSAENESIAGAARIGAEVSADESRTEPAKMMRDFVDGIQHTIDDWQKRVDANVHQAWENVSPLAPLQKEIQLLRRRIAELEKRSAPGANADSPDTDGDS